MRYSGVFWLTTWALLLGGAPRAAAIPSDDLRKSLRPTADVNDYAGLLTPAEKESLEARCRQLRQRTGAQLAVVTLQSLQGGQIDDFAEKLFKQWGIGDKEKKNGLLLIVAIDDRKARIEVGYGLEPIIPDALAGRIIDHQLRPRFREQKYAAGLSAAVNALCELVEKGEPADRAALARRAASSDDLFAFLFLSIFAALGGLFAGIGLGTRQGGTTIFGLSFVGLATFLGAAIVGIWAPFLHVPIALATCAFGYALAKQGGRRGSSSRGRSGSVPWVWGDTGSSGGGWTSGGGGFSQGWGGFGGGSSGGGGASGGW